MFYKKCKLHYAIHRSEYNTKDEHLKTKRPHYTRERMANYNRYAAHNHNSKDLEYDLTSQKRTSLNQTNDHLDVQVYVQIRVTRHPLHAQSPRHSQTRSDTKEVLHAEQKNLT